MFPGDTGTSEIIFAESLDPRTLKPRYFIIYFWVK
jgi:hypothetical protein